MSNEPNNSPLRLKKRHGDGQAIGVGVMDGQQLVNAQSIRNAIVASLISIVIFSLMWVSVTSIFEQHFPWFTLILGFLLGNAVRLAGRGVDWRFPVLAAVFTLLGAFVSNVVVGASVTADGFDTTTLEVLRSVTSMTWPVFFAEVLDFADLFFAVVAASFAAFYANRKLTRKQYHALRLWREGHDEQTN